MPALYTRNIALGLLLAIIIGGGMYVGSHTLRGDSLRGQLVGGPTAVCSTVARAGYSGNSYGVSPSVAIGNDGLPVIAYDDTQLLANGNDIKVAKCSDANCSTSTVSTVATIPFYSTYNWVRDPSVGIGSDGLPVLSFDQQTNGDDNVIKVVKCGNASCSAGNTTTEIATNKSTGSRLLIGSDGLPVIFFQFADVATPAIVIPKVVKCGNAACSAGNVTSVLPTGFPVSGTIIKGNDGLPVVAHYTGTSVAVTKCGNNLCTSGNVTTALENIGSSTTNGLPGITIGNDGFPVVSYYSQAASGLKVAKCGNAACSAGNTLSLVTTYADYWASTSIKIINSLPVISYYDSGTPKDLKIVRCGNAACSTGNVIDTVDAPNDMGYAVAMLAPTDAMPFMAYVDMTGSNLKVAKCTSSLSCACQTKTADMSISMTGPTTISPGGTATYTITIVNAGPDDVSIGQAFMYLTNASPSFSYNAAQSDPACSVNAAGELYCRRAVAQGQSTSFQIVLGVGTMACNQSKLLQPVVSAQATDPNPANNTASPINLVYACGGSSSSSSSPPSSVASSSASSQASSVSSSSVLSSSVASSSAISSVSSIASISSFSSASAASASSNGNVACLQQATVATNAKSPQVLMGSDGVPMVAFTDAQTNATVQVAKCGNLSCSSVLSTTTVDTGGRFYGLSMVGAPDGLPVLAYVDSTTTSLRFARCTHPLCTTKTVTTVDTSAGNYGPVSIGFNGSNQPVLVYRSATDGLKILTCGSVDCTSGNATTVLDASTVYPSSLLLRSGATPLIVYHKANNQTLTLLNCGNQTCTTGNTSTVLAIINTANTRLPMALGPDGKPRILYVNTDASNHAQLILIRCGDAICSSNNISTILQTATGTETFDDLSMIFPVDGSPVIGFTVRAGVTPTATIIKCGNSFCNAGNIITSVATPAMESVIAANPQSMPLMLSWDPVTNAVKNVLCSTATCVCAASSASSISSASSVSSAASSESCSNVKTTIPNGVSVFEVFGVAPDGLPVMLSPGSTNGFLMNVNVSKCSDSACQNRTTSTVSLPSPMKGGAPLAMTFGSDGLPILLVGERTNYNAQQLTEDLVVVKCGNATCSANNVYKALGASTYDTANQKASMVLGSDGKPVILYIGGTIGSAQFGLHVMKCGDSTCSAGNTDTLLFANNVMYHYLLAIGSDNLPLISYSTPSDNNGNMMLHVIHCGNAACTSGNTTKNIQQSGEGPTSLAIGSDGKPIFALLGQTGGLNVSVLKCADSACNASTVSIARTALPAPAAGFTPPSIAIGSDGLPVLSYDIQYTGPGGTAYDSGDLGLTHCGDVSCTTGNVSRVVDTAGNAGMWSKIMIAGDGMPIVQYVDTITTGGGGLKILKCSDETCSNACPVSRQGSSANSSAASGVSSSAASVGSAVSIASAPSTTVSACLLTASVDTAGTTGWAPSMTTDTNFRPVVSYFDVTNQALKILACGSPGCIVGGAMVTGDGVGTVNAQHTSIQYPADGLPVLSYYDAPSKDLKVLKCGTPTCSGNNTKVTVDSLGDVGKSNALAIGTDGKPVIAYYDDLPNGDLKFVRCGSVDCSQGNTVVQLDSTGTVGDGVSMAIGTDGKPVISYQDKTGTHLKVLHCGDAGCTAGNVSTTLDPAAGALPATAIAIGSDSNPIIAYLRVNGPKTHVLVIHCSDPTCASFSGPLSLDSGSFPHDSIAINMTSSGLPILSYSTTEQKLLLCGNANCSSGNVSMAIETAGFSGGFTALTVPGDRQPVISYFDEANGDLKIAKCLSADCTCSSSSSAASIASSLPSSSYSSVSSYSSSSSFSYFSLALQSSAMSIFDLSQDPNDIPTIDKLYIPNPRGDSLSAKDLALLSTQDPALFSTIPPGYVAHGACDGNECNRGGSYACSLRGMSCLNVSPAPCVRCYAPAAVAAALRKTEKTIGSPLMIAKLPQKLQNLSLTIENFCGDGKLQNGEQCDAGAKNSNLPGALCRPNCQRSHCGDNVVDPPSEQCDDGNVQSRDGCSERCQREPSLAATEVLPVGVIELPFASPSAHGVAPRPSESLSIPLTATLSSMPPTTIYASPSHAPIGQTGPASLAIMVAGASAGYSWVRRRMR